MQLWTYIHKHSLQADLHMQHFNMGKAAVSYFPSWWYRNKLFDIWMLVKEMARKKKKKGSLLAKDGFLVKWENLFPVSQSISA